MTTTDLAIGIDLGGTNLRAAAFRGLGAACDHPAEVATAVRSIAAIREAVGDERSPAAIVERVAQTVERVSAEAGGGPDTPVGIGFAGMLRGTDGLVVNSPHLRWREVRFGALLRERLPQRPVVVENDVNAITWGELRLGAGRGEQDLIAVFVGTGIGGGVIAGGRLIRGATGCAAELGHVKVAWGPGAVPCACGKAGCIEAYVGGEYLQRRVRVELAAGQSSRAVALAGSAAAVNPGHVDVAAAEGDPWALALWAELGPLLGVVLANAVTTLNPGTLILGGGVLGRTPVLRERVIASLRDAGNAPALDELVVLDAALGDDAGLVGSALLALRPEPS